MNIDKENDDILEADVFSGDSVCVRLIIVFVPFIFTEIRQINKVNAVVCYFIGIVFQKNIRCLKGS